MRFSTLVSTLALALVLLSVPSWCATSEAPSEEPTDEASQPTSSPEDADESSREPGSTTEPSAMEEHSSEPNASEEPSPEPHASEEPSAEPNAPAEPATEPNDAAVATEPPAEPGSSNVTEEALTDMTCYSCDSADDANSCPLEGFVAATNKEMSCSMSCFVAVKGENVTRGCGDIDCGAEAGVKKTADSTLYCCTERLCNKNPTAMELGCSLNSTTLKCGGGAGALTPGAVWWLAPGLTVLLHFFTAAIVSQEQ